MWSLRVLSGDLAGKSFQLNPGTNVVGRGSHCDVSLPLPNISKEHLKIEVYNDKIVLTDLNSRNGTFVNGVKIQTYKLRYGERIALYDTFIEIIQPRSRNVVPMRQPGADAFPAPTHDNLAFQQQPRYYEQAQAQQSQQVPGFSTWLGRYIDGVVLPGVYKLAEWFEFRWVVGIFVTLFIVVVTALSTIPLMRILKASVQQESQRRALTIARILADQNRSPLAQGLTYGGVSVEVAEREPGVTRAYIISNENGGIVAPANLVGQAPSEAFVHQARKLGSETVQQIDDTTIGALVPVKFYNPSVHSDTIVAHAVVIYNMGSLAVDDSRILSLFVQILFIAIIVGAILYFFLIKSVEQPLVELNDQLSTGLREGKFSLNTKYLFPVLHSLITNINSAISRREGAFGQDQLADFEADRSMEMRNILGMIGFPAIAIQPAERSIYAVNELFQEQFAGQQNWNMLKVEQILDQALKLNLQSLLDRVTGAPNDLAVDQLEIGNNFYDLSAQAVRGSKDLAYIVVTFTPRGGPG